MNNIRNESSIKLSRADIETLCVLHAVGKAGCRVGDLAVRLGLSASLASAVAEGMGLVIHGGLLDRSDERFTLTEQGRQVLTGWMTWLGLG